MKIGVIKYNKEYLENINSQLEGLGVKTRVRPKNIGVIRKQLDNGDIELRLMAEWGKEDITVSIPREYVHITTMDDESLENYANFSSNMAYKMLNS